MADVKYNWLRLWVSVPWRPETRGVVIYCVDTLRAKFGGASAIPVLRDDYGAAVTGLPWNPFGGWWYDPQAGKPENDASLAIIMSDIDPADETKVDEGDSARGRARDPFAGHRIARDRELAYAHSCGLPVVLPGPGIF